MDTKTLKKNIACGFCKNTIGTQVQLYTLHLTPGRFFYTASPENLRSVKCDVTKYGKFYQVNNQLRIAADDGITEGIRQYLHEAKIFSHETVPKFTPYLTIQYCCRNDYAHIFKKQKNISRTHHRTHHDFVSLIVLGDLLKKIFSDRKVLSSRVSKYIMNNFDEFYKFALETMGDPELWEDRLDSEYDWWKKIM